MLGVDSRDRADALDFAWYARKSQREYLSAFYIRRSQDYSLWSAADRRSAG